MHRSCLAIDPWSGGGVLREPNDQVKMIIIPDIAHHLDLRESNPNGLQPTEWENKKYTNGLT